MSELNELIHQPVRLKIMASLISLDVDEKVDFSHLKRLLELSDGNLGAHLGKLEATGYILVEKAFVGRKPRTFVSATGAGRDAFNAHIKALQEILSGSQSADDPAS